MKKEILAETIPQMVVLLMLFELTMVNHSESDSLPGPNHPLVATRETFSDASVAAAAVVVTSGMSGTQGKFLRGHDRKTCSGKQ